MCVICSISFQILVSRHSVCCRCAAKFRLHSRPFLLAMPPKPACFYAQMPLCVQDICSELLIDLKTKLSKTEKQNNLVNFATNF